jgi:phosphosulfolactate phosphohydrolase-like enzyme
VCSGTGEDAAFEDALGAGALCEILSGAPAFLRLHDSAAIAVEMFRAHRHDLSAAMRYSRNGRRLLEMPELAPDVAFCLQRDTSSVVARMVAGVIRSERAQ